MNPLPFHRLAAAASLVALSAVPVAAWADGNTSFEMAVIDLVNIERANANLGLAPLLFDARLQASALFHSKDMAMTPCFQHNSCDGTDTFVRIAMFYPGGGAGENIAAGYTTPEAVMVGWMDSPGHKANILSPDFVGIGVGYWAEAGSPYTHYWTQNFGNLTPVPEPATSLLWGVAVLGFIAARRRLG